VLVFISEPTETPSKPNRPLPLLQQPLLCFSPFKLLSPKSQPVSTCKLTSTQAGSQLSLSCCLTLSPSGLGAWQWQWRIHAAQRFCGQRRKVGAPGCRIQRIDSQTALDSEPNKAVVLSELVADSRATRQAWTASTHTIRLGFPFISSFISLPWI
jgi:hypothetical protein